jgi:hypothetical protein
MRYVLVFAASGEVATGLALLVFPSLVGRSLLGEDLAGIAIQVARAEAQDADHVRSALLVRACLRVHRGDAESAADAEDPARSADVARDAHGADQRDEAAGCCRVGLVPA